MFWGLKLLGWAILALAGAAALLWTFGPYEPVETARRFDPENLGSDIDAYLARSEARFDDIIPGAEKRVHWAGEPGARTDLVLIYAHGFSATALETAPLPQMVGQKLDANVISMRLAGHGRGGAAMAEASVADWIYDLDEALAIAERIGNRTILLGVSTGATLVTLGLQSGRQDQMDGVVLMSPNFRIRNPLSVLLTFPAVRYWGPRLLGAERSWEPHNDLHAAGWTTRYPTVATLPMAAMVQHVRQGPVSEVSTPMLLLYSAEDQVIDPKAALAIAEKWGGPVSISEQILTEADDPSRHVLAGDALSPARTDQVANEIADWMRRFQE